METASQVMIEKKRRTRKFKEDYVNELALEKMTTHKQAHDLCVAAKEIQSLKKSLAYMSAFAWCVFLVNAACAVSVYFFHK